MFEEDSPRPIPVLISLLLAIAYIVGGISVDGLVGGFRVFVFCLVPLACIWFPEVMGDYAGSIVASRINAPSHPAFVRALGWVVLLLPLIVLALLWTTVR